MKKDSEKKSNDEMRSEYDFSQGIRGKYRNRIHSGDTDPKNCEVEATVWLDGELIEYFEQLAKRKTTSFSMQINATLRQAMKSKQNITTNDYSALVRDENFITAVAARVKALVAA